MSSRIAVVIIVILIGLFLFVKYGMPSTYSGLMVDVSRLFSNSRVVQSSTQRPSYESNCLNVVSDKVDIFNQKYSGTASATILKVQSFDNKDEAKGFADTWSTKYALTLTTAFINSEIDSLNLPLTIVVVKIQGQGGIVNAPIVCSNGTIGSYSSQVLSI